MAQTKKDRMDERRGEMRHERRMEMDRRHESEGMERAMMRRHGDDKREGLGMRSAGEGRYRDRDHVYENEVDKPVLPPEGRPDSGLGMYGFKGEADPIAYGQASEEGCRRDMERMEAQFKDYHWD